MCRILILEDDLKTLSLLLDRLSELEHDLSYTGKQIAVTVLSEYTQVENYINSADKVSFDVILLDRDCKVGGSFHVLDFTKFDPKKIIAISSVPEYNELLKGKGITKMVWKDYSNPSVFVEKVMCELTAILDSDPS